MIPVEECRGCRDDFYNGHNDLGVKRCWRAKDGEMVTRYRIHWWAAPTKPGAYTEVTVPSCYHQPGQYAYHKSLPAFVKAADVVRSKRRTA